MTVKRLALKAKTIKNNKTAKKIEFVGYSGGLVDLSDHDLDAPAVYDLETLRIANGGKMKLMYNHRTAIGHTTMIENSKKAVSGEAVLSVKNRITKKIENAADAEFPYEMSMGLDARKIKVLYFPNGTIANGRTFKREMYVIKNTSLDEITVT